jgi:thymidylate kinase
MLICFIGVDGVGKTTISKKLVEILRKNGINSVYSYGRVVPVCSRMVIWLGRRLFLGKSKGKNSDYLSYNVEKKKLIRNGASARIYEFSILFDQIFQNYVKITPLVFSKKVVVCDRYIYDVVITDLAVDFDLTNEQVLHFTDTLSQIVPKPDLIFFIDAPEEIAFKRKHDTPHLDYLRTRRKIYQAFSRSKSLVTLDGTKSIDSICAEVIHVINIWNAN